MMVWSVLHTGYYSPSGDFAPNVLGVYSSHEKAVAAVKVMMLDEILSVRDARDDIEETDDELHAMSFDDLRDRWCDVMEVEPIKFIERNLDANCLAIEAGSIIDGVDDDGG